MYATGTAGTFISRMQQLPTGLFELSGASNSFWSEGVGYFNSGIISTGTAYNYSHVFASKYYEITKTGIKPSLNYF